MGIALRLDRTTQAVDNMGRPLSGYLTVEAATSWMTAHDAEMPAYVEAQFSVVRDIHISVERQVAMFAKRLRAIAKGCNRVVTRVEPAQAGSVIYRALLVR